MTRAQDHLVLLGEKTGGESYSRWLRDAGSDELSQVPRELEQGLEDWLKREEDVHEKLPDWISALEPETTFSGGWCRSPGHFRTPPSKDDLVSN